MNENKLKKLVEDSLDKLLESDKALFERDISERCLTARWMYHLQILMSEWHVDVEFNREGFEHDPKRLDLDPKCANKVNSEGKACVVPDLIIHQRGPEGPNLFVAELKKTTNSGPRECDHNRIAAFRRQFGYTYGAVIELETRKNHNPEAKIIEWYSS